jgi:TonB family protein
MKLSILLFLLVLTAPVCAQDFDTTYLSGSSAVAKDNAEAYRLVSRMPVDGYYLVREFDMKGSLKAQGGSIRRDSVALEGYVIRYKPGVGKSSEGAIEAGRQQGLWRYYYPETGRTKRDVTYVDGIKDGRLKSYYPDGSLKRDQVFQDDLAVSGDCYKPNGKMWTCSPYYVLPEFPGDVRVFLADKLRYPDSAFKAGIVGRVVVKFIMEEDGRINGVKVGRSVHPLLDKEAMRVTWLMPRWKPALEDDEPVKSYFSLPMKFSID